MNLIFTIIFAFLSQTVLATDSGSTIEFHINDYDVNNGNTNCFNFTLQTLSSNLGIEDLKNDLKIYFKKEVAKLTQVYSWNYLPNSRFITGRLERDTVVKILRLGAEEIVENSVCCRSINLPPSDGTNPSENTSLSEPFRFEYYVPRIILINFDFIVENENIKSDTKTSFSLNDYQDFFNSLIKIIDDKCQLEKIDIKNCSVYLLQENFEKMDITEPLMKELKPEREKIELEHLIFAQHMWNSKGIFVSNTAN